MAEKRMFSRKITNHDNFTSLPATAQALYFHLVMDADDDGFCDRTNIAIGNAHAKKKDLDLLVKLHYVIKFDSGIYAVKHWHMQNTIRADRHTPTEYQEELSKLTRKPNGAYAMPSDNQTADNARSYDGQMTAEPQPSDNQTADTFQQNAALGLGLGLNYIHTPRARAREEEKDPDDFEAFWMAYPRKTGDTRTAYMEYLDALNKGAKPELLIEAATALGERTKPEDFNYLPAAEKWLRNKGWLEQAAREKVNENGSRQHSGKPENGTGKQFDVRYDNE